LIKTNEHSLCGITLPEILKFIPNMPTRNQKFLLASINQAVASVRDNIADRGLKGSGEKQWAAIW
jgi:hypothetical protein